MMLFALSQSSSNHVRWLRNSSFVSTIWHTIQQRLRRAILRSGPAYEQTPQHITTQKALAHGYSGWRGGLLASTISIAICLVAEAVFLVVALKLNDPAESVLYQGSCNRVKNLTTYLLIPMNVLGTVTIGSSNYVMQILNAPSRL